MVENLGKTTTVFSQTKWTLFQSKNLNAKMEQGNKVLIWKWNIKSAVFKILHSPSSTKSSIYQLNLGKNFPFILLLVTIWLPQGHVVTLLCSEFFPSHIPSYQGAGAVLGFLIRSCFSQSILPFSFLKHHNMTLMSSEIMPPMNFICCDHSFIYSRVICLTLKNFNPCLNL